MKARAALLTLFLVGWGEAAAQSVGSVTLYKDSQYLQATAGSVVPLLPNPYRFSTGVGNDKLETIPAPVLSGPGAGATLQYVGNSVWVFSVQRATQAQLDASYPSGAYTLAINGTNVGLNLSGDAYPAPPVLTLTGGTWSGGKYVVDPRQPITASTSAFAEFGSGVDAALQLFVGHDGGNVADAWSYRSSSGVNSAFVTIPANTLVEGAEYYIAAVFEVDVDRNTTVLTPSRNTAGYRAITNATIKAQATPVFPLTVTSNITPTVANATATFQPRPQDVGTTASVFVFAVAPSNRVLNATQNKAAALAWKAEGATTDTPVQCVLAQLNSSGQLTAVSASSLQASITGILAAQAQSLGILNNTPTPNVAGATFYIGYGASASAMINNGINQRAVEVPGDIKCDPKAPKTGWWWNTTEGGRGYSIEVAGNHIFFASYLYDLSGRSTWYVGSGNTSLDGSLFTGDLQSFSRGQTLGGTYRVPAGLSAGSLTLAFADATHGTVIWPGGSVAIERYNIVQNGTSMNPMANEPESGWWWNPEESGRGFFLEWQGGELFMAGYMYDDNGDPVWNLSTNTTPSANLQSYSGSWWRYGNGQTLTGPYKPATRLDDNVAPVTITFSGAETALMTLPNGRTTNIRRFRF